MREGLVQLQSLIRRRNNIDLEIAGLIGRPAERSHIGEFLARAIFDISEPESASQANNDGVFRHGPLADRTVNIKFYGKDDGVWAVNEYPAVDYYLVLCGASGGTASSRGQTRPLVVANVYLVPEIALQGAHVKPGVAASVRQGLRSPHQIYPTCGPNAALRLDPDRMKLLDLFAEVVP